MAAPDGRVAGRHERDPLCAPALFHFPTTASAREVRQWLVVQPRERHQLERIDSALSALALRNERLRLAKTLRRLNLCQPCVLARLAQACGKGAVGIASFRLRSHAPEDIPG